MDNGEQRRATNITLMDVLPHRACAPGDEGMRMEIALPPASAPATHRMLLATLAWVEMKLTGGDTALLTRLDGGRVLQARVPVPRAESCAEWGAALNAIDLPVVVEPGPVAWALADDVSSPLDVVMRDTPGVASVWRIGSDGNGLEAAFRAPLGEDAARLLQRCVLRAWTQLWSVDSTFDDVDLIDVDESSLLLEWGGYTGPSGPSGTVHERFSAVCGMSPGSAAIVDGELSLTYAELDRMSSLMARTLAETGVSPGDIVAVGLPRSAGAVVAMLGILKAGAAYLPIDLSQPPDRLRFLLRDAAVNVAICPAVDEGTLGQDVTVLVGDLKITSPDAVDTGELGRATAEATNGDSLAYVLYTSGSTGVPKGVEIRHRSILRLVCGVDYIQLSNATRMLHAAPLGFDASTLELWGPLLNGGCVVVHDEEVPTGAGLATTIARHRVTTAWLTAALFNAIVDEDPLQLEGLDELFTGGEALSVDHVRRFRLASPAVRLHNGYGPTECTTFTCTQAIEGIPGPGCTSIPIGRPIQDTRVHVLNASRRPVPIGAVGELYVGGGGVARGYLARPEMTEDRFVPDPFGDSDGRLYRTGDYVRWIEDGTLEFIGRMDGQVKIRGFRIELGEIEAALAQHAAVQSCAVVAREEGAGEKRLVAYYVGSTDDSRPHELRAYLARRLPDFMVPVRYVRLDAWPVTPNGKLDRKALPAPDCSRPELSVSYEPPVGEDEKRVCSEYGALLGIDHVGRNDNFFELGGSSLLALRLAERLRAAGPQRWGNVTATALFNNPTPALLVAALAGPGTASHVAAEAQRVAADDDPIAIIAMAGRFPGAGDVEAFWRNLCEGRDSITFFGKEELDPSVPCADRGDPAYVAARGVIDDVDMFDAGFFGFSPREAELMDPQHRVFLELCWECLERGGHVPDSGQSVVGVFAGMYNATYFQKHLAGRTDLIDRIGAFQVMLENEKDYITTRVAHKLNLTGPAISVHTACSTSLVALCQAVDSLRARRCEMALAGGASVTCPPRSGYRYQEGGMLSPDGHTRTFDVRASGTVFSDGAAVVLLKRWSDAVRDGNPVYAVIRGCAVNNDGANKASFTAPSSVAQASVVAMAHADAGVGARSIGYVEAHGTATPLGDPIEIEGLTQAFRRATDDVGFCRIGSAKSNVGHTVVAAGAVGVIKTALSLQQECIPGTVHFSSANPVLRLEQSPFTVSADLDHWPRGDVPRRAGVSSFGVGGTNAHVVLEEAPLLPASESACGPQLLVLSARSPSALNDAAHQLGEHLVREPSLNLADVAWTLAVGRKAFPYRMAVTAADAVEAVAALACNEGRGGATQVRPSVSREVVFLFPGQGATYAGMGRGLHGADPVFRTAVDECAAVLMPVIGYDLRERMFAEDPDVLMPTAVMQPATFVLEYALARAWMGRGVIPSAMIGHSVGEFVAATLAGVFDLPDALRLVAKRGQWMQARPSGGMLSVRMPLDALLPRLPENISLAAENAPQSCVVAGPHDALDAFQHQLEAEGVACRALRTSHAFHSSMMEPVVERFLAEVASVVRSAPSMPIVSTATGDWLRADEAQSPEYWARHLREPVRFSRALARGVEGRDPILLEAGPRATLSTLARQNPAAQGGRVQCVASFSSDPERESVDFLAAAGALWCEGANVDVAAFDGRSTRRRVRLPTYPFERQRYWVEAPSAQPLATGLSQPTGPSDVFQQPMPAATVVQEHVMQVPDSQPHATDRKPALIARLKDVFDDIAGFDLQDASSDANFMELGLDSLMLTQVALQLEKTFGVKVSFRQLMGECGSLTRLAGMLDRELPSEPAEPTAPVAAHVAATPDRGPAMSPQIPPMSLAGDDFARQVIAQQMQLMAQQLALLGVGAGITQGSVASKDALGPPQPAHGGLGVVSSGAAAAVPAPTPAGVHAGVEAADEEAALAHVRYDVKKAFGAIARIDNNARIELDDRQRGRLNEFIGRYTARTRKSKEYTRAHRPHMADPRVVNGFRPLTKEIVYQIVIERSNGAHVVDLDGNDYVDALNGFGMSLFGWQPDFVVQAVRRQMELGYEIGPQHPLAGEVARLLCEVTGHDRAALCNTGSEAVLGALRIARTVTGRDTVVLFTGSYHGIIDEMIVRGTRKLRAVPAAPGILRNTSEHVLVLEYGTDESMKIIRERAHEIAAVLVEPVQSRRPDFQPRQFLSELRKVTSNAGALLVFDEVVTGFRAHPAGAQGLFSIRADLATYGKVVGGGFPIGVIAGKREYMDALDGGQWDFGDASVPTVGVTYFAGTFVRHPLALAAAHAVLNHIKEQGPGLQEALSERTTAMAAELNGFCAERGAPVEVRHFASVWKTFFLEDHPLQDLLFAMMRSRGIHILDNFPCFLTTAHAAADIRRIIEAFKDSIVELQDAGFLPRHAVTPQAEMDAERPAVAGARLGRDVDGRPAWFIPNPEQPGKYLKVGG